MSPNEPTPQDPNKSTGMGIALLNNRYLLWLSIFMVMMAGISALMNMPRLEDPRITHRNPAIFVFYPGVSAERIEALVTKTGQTPATTSRSSPRSVIDSLKLPPLCPKAPARRSLTISVRPLPLP